MRARRTMPLPKSVVCSSCKKTYPEGWRRCPYCGHDQVRVRNEAQSKRFMQKKIQEFEHARVPADAYGVGSSLFRGQLDFTADVVLLEGKPCAKAGRVYRPNPRLEAVD